MRDRAIPLAVLGAGVLVAVAVLLHPATSRSEPLAGAKAATGTVDSSRSLSFNGSASITLKPDTAMVTVDANGTGATSQEALADASQKMQKVLGALTSLTTVKIADDDLQTGDVYTYQDSDTSTWHAENSVTVTVHDPTQAGVVIGTANDAGADSVDGPTFSVQDQRDAYRKALRMAIEDARSKADAAADAMGVTVSGVVSVQEQSDSTPVMASADTVRASASPSEVPVKTGTIDVAASVAVTFAYAS